MINTSNKLSCKFLTVLLHGQSKMAANNGFVARLEDVIKCQPRGMPRTLPAMLDDQTIRIVCKVIGELSSTRLWTGFDVNLNFIER